MSCSCINILQRGTTPTITMTYRAIDLSMITEAWMSIRQQGGAQCIVDRDLNSATVGENTLSWTLTQEETLRLLPLWSAEIQCRYLLSDGTAGASPIYRISVSDLLKEGVIQ